MSHSNLPNLHPVWRKALGLQEPAAAQPLDATSPWARSDLAQAIADIRPRFVRFTGGWLDA